eukprot:1005888-Pelagomonas_calceolata.AAC.2
MTKFDAHEDLPTRRVLSTMLEHSPHPIYSYKAHSGILGNGRADACACTVAPTNTTEIALPDARDSFHNFYWLSLKTSLGQTDGLHLSHTFPIHYLTNLNGTLKVQMHKKSKLGSADTSGYQRKRKIYAGHRPRALRK